MAGDPASLGTSWTAWGRPALAHQSRLLLHTMGEPTSPQTPTHLCRAAMGERTGDPLCPGPWVPSGHAELIGLPEAPPPCHPTSGGPPQDVCGLGAWRNAMGAGVSPTGPLCPLPVGPSVPRGSLLYSPKAPSQATSPALPLIPEKGPLQPHTKNPAFLVDPRPALGAWFKKAF